MRRAGKVGQGSGTMTSRTLGRMLGQAALVLGVLPVAGCHKPAPQAEMVFGQAVTFKTAEAAPGAFDAWDFAWRGPKRDANKALEAVVLAPDGGQYWKQIFAAFPGPSEKIETSYSPGFAGGDPKILQGQAIRVRFRVEQGEPSFSQADVAGFKFDFFKRDARGDVDWRVPFKTVAAVKER